MSKEQKAPAEGWGKGWHSHRTHYFQGMISMCGMAKRRSFLKNGRMEFRRVGPHDCKDCWRALIDTGKINDVDPLP